MAGESQCIECGCFNTCIYPSSARCKENIEKYERKEREKLYQKLYQKQKNSIKLTFTCIQCALQVTISAYQISRYDYHDAPFDAVTWDNVADIKGWLIDVDTKYGGYAHNVLCPECKK